VSLENPYAPPQTDLTDPLVAPEPTELADRGTRLVAAFVDGILDLIASLPLMHFLGFFDAIKTQQTPPLRIGVLAGVLGFVVFLVIHGYLLATRGQTVGKWLTGIRIANLNGGVPSFATLILRRYLPIRLAAQIPVIGGFFPLIDCLFIFRGDRRCIHDHIAETKVVTVATRS
jgi:uncharacterized RDD family membrane protein YckC